jgi:GNAT superfamily N-acetyltransferase
MLEIVEEDSKTLMEYASIPISFDVRELLATASLTRPRDVLPLRTSAPATPFTKDYDAYPGNGPLSWPARFDVDRWGFFAARLHGRRVGGAVVITGDRGVELLDRRGDLALLWDLRVSPDARRSGVGAALLTAVEEWARARKAVFLRVETQHVNVPACRFYAKSGFAVETIARAAYPELPDEVQLLWSKRLARSAVRP